MREVVLRNAESTDVERMLDVERLAAMLFPPEDLPPAIAALDSRTAIQRAVIERLAWVAEVHGAGVVGFLVARTENTCLHIAEMDVLPAFCRRGIGRALLELACLQARKAGLCAVTLTTFAHLPWNAPFYARHGFHIIAEAPAHLDAALRDEAALGLHNRVAMRRDLC